VLPFSVLTKVRKKQRRRWPLQVEMIIEINSGMVLPTMISRDRRWVIRCWDLW
jgi:hypothetical protein